MRIQHNIAAMNSYRNYVGNANSLNRNLEKLSSGYRINRAGDDAAGLAISEKMRAQIAGLDQAQANVKDGISLVKTAEGALQEVQDMMNRMVTLATQSANGTYQDKVDRENLQAELDAMLDEIDRISKSSNFNGQKLLDGSLGGMSVNAKDAVIPQAPTIGGTVSGVKTGATENATFEYTPTYDPTKTQTMQVLGQYFEIGPDADGTAMVAGEEGTGTEGDPFKITTTADDTAKTISDKIAAKLNGLKGAGAGFDYGDKTFKVTVDDAGKMTFTATTQGHLKVDEETFDTVDKLTSHINTSVTLVEKKDDTGNDTPAAGGATTAYGTGTAGKTAVGAATSAVATFDLTEAIGEKSAFADGDKVTVNGKTYVFKTNGGSASAAGDEILVELAAEDTTVATQLTKLVSKIPEVSGYTAAVGADNKSITFTSTATGSSATIADNAFTGATSTVNGKDQTEAVAGKMDMTLSDLGKAKLGDTIKIGSTTYQIIDSKGTGDYTEVTQDSGYKAIDLNGQALDATTLKTALDSAVTSANASDYAVTTTADGTAGTLKIEITQKTGADKTVEELKNDLVYSAVEGDENADPGQGVSNFDHLIATTAGGGDTDGVGQTELNFTSNPQAGSSFTVDGKTFEFVAAGGAAQTQGAIAVEIGADLDATMTNLKTKVNGETYTNVQVSVSDDGKTFLFKNKADATTDPTANNKAPEVKVNGGGLKLQIGDTGDAYNTLTVSINDMSTKGLKIDTLRDVGIMSVDSANAAIQTIKDAINLVSSQRGDLGAIQNRLEHTSNNLSVMEENIQDAESTIRDTDIADEMTSYTKNNILLQSAQAMLAQANQMPQGVLQLLQ